MSAGQADQTIGQPLVTVLTPVYNGAEFLRECIESVLAQDYENWEYVIVNNRSTDGTLEIAESYAKEDPRIRVVTNSEFLSMPQNFNRAFDLVGTESRYFKVVCADDWILPRCLSRMVAFAEAHPSVGVLCCHQQSGEIIRWAELPQSVTTLPGREACRKALLQGLKLFGAPTAFLYRSELLRKGKPFFPNDQPHSDSSACYESLEYCDYGVVHEVLAVERIHEGQISSGIEPLGSGNLAYLEVLLEYGPRFLSDFEWNARKRVFLAGYYRFLGRSLLKMSGARFWEYQRRRLGEMGCRLAWQRVLREAIKEGVTELARPATVFQKLAAVLSMKSGSRF